MKKKLGFIIGGIAAVGILGFGIYYSGASQVEAAMSTEEIKKKIIAQYPGEITEIEKETEFNRVVYEIEIVNDEKEYDIKLDGNTGEVLEIKEKPVKKPTEFVQDDVEKEKQQEVKKEVSSNEEDVKIIEKEIKVTQKKGKETSNNQVKESTSKKENNKAKRTVISVEEAKKIALAAFPGEIDDIELDTEDGRLIYEIEIEQGDREAEIEIDAYTGKIIVMEIDED